MVMKAEFYFNIKYAGGDLADVLMKALPEAKKITVNGKAVNWPDEELQPPGPVVVYFEDGSFLKIADIHSPLSKNVKITWGWDDREILNTLN
jgi:hypothetical protein